MTDATSAGGSYTMGYSPEFLQLLDRRNAETHAGHLLPHLMAGCRVLDFGCGPGTITVGLAQAVHPGEVHGIDMEESQIELARAAAAAGGHDNATFHVGNVYELPFVDDYFDAAHCHAVLMHVPDTQRALREVSRVLKPGGIIASRELIGVLLLQRANRRDSPRSLEDVHQDAGRQRRSSGDGQGAQVPPAGDWVHGRLRQRFI